MKFWDSSALIPLLVDESSSRERRQLLEFDPDIVTWWGTMVECESAIARLNRVPGTDFVARQTARDLLNAIAADWVEISPDNQVRTRACRLLRLHPLRAADALQLAAALTAAAEQTTAIEFVCNDQRLSEAARLEGFTTV